MLSLAHSVRQKLKLALLLAILTLILLASNIFERRNASHIDHCFESMYADRLLPSAYIFHLTHHFYQRRLLLQSHLTQRNALSHRECQAQIEAHAHTMDSLISDFEKTYLVGNEEQILTDFKRELASYHHFEQNLMGSEPDFIHPEATDERLVRLFDLTLKELTALSHIQLSVGKHLLDDSHSKAANSRLLTTLELALLVVVALLVQLLVLTSRKIVVEKPRMPNLN
jgi:hypothetical protein